MGLPKVYSFRMLLGINKIHANIKGKGLLRVYPKMPKDFVANFK